MSNWMWVQPKDQAALLERLAYAVAMNVPERERENLCACALAEIERLRKALEAALIPLAGLHWSVKWELSPAVKIEIAHAVEAINAALSGGVHE